MRRSLSAYALTVSVVAGDGTARRFAWRHVAGTWCLQILDGEPGLADPTPAEGMFGDLPTRPGVVVRLRRHRLALQTAGALLALGAGIAVAPSSQARFHPHTRSLPTTTQLTTEPQSDTTTVDTSALDTGTGDTTTAAAQTTTDSTTTDGQSPVTDTGSGAATTPPDPGLTASGDASVAAPIPPGSYSIPSGVVVSSSDELAAALAEGLPTIILADGTYGASSYFADANGSSLYAEHVGGAVLTAGLAVGGNFDSGGAVIEGLAFDVTDPSTTFQNSELDTWGAAGANTQVLDSTFEGNWAIGVGLLAANPDGLIAERLQFAHFTDEGIRASDNNQVPYGSPTSVINTISDISVDGVGESTPGSSGGTAESGMWIAQPVANGVARIAIRDCALSGIETTGNAWDTTFSDFTIDSSGPHVVNGVSVYIEHFTTNDVFTNFQITGARVGFNAEWDDGLPGNGAAQNDTIENGTIDASGWNGGGNTAGVYLDAGTGAVIVQNISFLNQSWAGIGAYKTAGPDTFTNNTFGLAAGAVDVSPGHV